MSIWWSLLAALVALQSSHGFETETSFSGNLERVGNESISIRLSDRRVICAMLPSTPPPLSVETIAAHYRVGDQVEITSKPIQPVWEKGTSRYQYLEVTMIRLLRRPSPEELAKILEAKPFREGENLLERPDSGGPVPKRTPDLTGPGSQEFEHARRINLEYVAHMPNFVADETAKRYRSTSKSPHWSNFDTIESEVTFEGDTTVRRQLRRNGKPWEQPFEALPGFKWYGGFGSEITPVFDPQCPTTIDYRGRSQVGERQLLEYQFSTPVDGCFPFFYFHYQRYNPPRTGHVFIDEPSGSLFQLDEDTRGFPAEFEFAEREERITWDYVKIGEDSHLLPVRAYCLAVYYSGTQFRIEVEYKNHRHFQSSTNLKFNQ
jgi:hypothetical protein